MLGYLSLDIICSASKLTVFLRYRRTVRFWEEIMSADKHLKLFSRQKEAIVYLKSLNPHYSQWGTLSEIQQHQYRRSNVSNTR